MINSSVFKIGSLIGVLFFDLVESKSISISSFESSSRETGSIKVSSFVILFSTSLFLDPIHHCFIFSGVHSSSITIKHKKKKARLVNTPTLPI